MGGHDVQRAVPDSDDDDLRLPPTFAINLFIKSPFPSLHSRSPQLPLDLAFRLHSSSDTASTPLSSSPLLQPPRPPSPSSSPSHRDGRKCSRGNNRHALRDPHSDGDGYASRHGIWPHRRMDPGSRYQLEHAARDGRERRDSAGGFILPRKLLAGGVKDAVVEVC